jgi:hypothetical protein
MMTPDPISSLAPWYAAAVRASRTFLRRAVIHLTELGIDQFVDLGSGPSCEPDLAEIIQVRNPRAQLVRAAGQPSLDPGRPVAALMVGVLERLSDDEAADLLRAVRQASPPGSCLAIAHLTVAPAAGEWHPRTSRQIRELFDGYELLRPGLVPADRWRAPGTRGPGPIPVLAGVGRLPDRDEPRVH